MAYDARFRFDEVMKGLTAMKAELPYSIAKIMQKYFTQSFYNQGWADVQWAEVDRATPGTPAYEHPYFSGSRTNPILWGETGNLRNDVEHSFRSASWSDGIRFSVDGPSAGYASYLNEGFVARNGRPIPPRTFMGDSPEMQWEIEEEVVRAMDRMFGI